jgi:uncharacterized protein (TIGR00290 family)
MTMARGEIMPEKILLSWSGGKDSAMSFWEIQKRGQYEVAALLTTITEDYDRISMHGVRRELLERQAEAVGVRLEKICIPRNATNGIYEERMKRVLENHHQTGIEKVAFGDIFLEDLKQYREKNLALIGMKGLFPIWRRDSSELARAFITAGFKAVVVCVDPKHLAPSFAGMLIDEEFLRRLPPGVDPCGENGEFHSFVFAGPVFKEEIRFTRGEVVEREGFWFCDLLPT